jgi:transposase InsO family protein
MKDNASGSMRVRWARLRLMIVGPLLGSPPKTGELKAAIGELSTRAWCHPSTGQSVQFSAKTIERWFYAARQKQDPFAALARKVPRHTGTHRSLSVAATEKIRMLRREHPSWTFKLVYDNLVVLAQQDASLGNLPSYPTVCRYMKQNGLLRFHKRRHESKPEFIARERRSYEVSHVHGLWHFDFHDGRRNVLCASGEWKQPHLLGFLDDYSRLCCHVQWYLHENTEALVHGLCQALQKRGLPRAVLSDNGSAMTAAETTEGLERLGILQQLTLPYSPEQNAKQEVFWAQTEGRLMAMLENESSLTLELLNTATQAWVEQEYHRRVHSETGQTPLERWLQGPSVGRDCPSSDTLRHAFRTEVSRKQRRSDGTVTCEGVRYEISSRYRTLVQVTLRVARWDLSCVELVDPRTGTHLETLLPLDKRKNADRRRRALTITEPGHPKSTPTPEGIAPLLRRLMADYAATGVPPAYIPKDDTQPSDPNPEEKS